jgi:hypothetical protein
MAVCRFPVALQAVPRRRQLFSSSEPASRFDKGRLIDLARLDPSEKLGFKHFLVVSKRMQGVQMLVAVRSGCERGSLWYWHRQTRYNAPDGDVEGVGNGL